MNLLMTSIKILRTRKIFQPQQCIYFASTTFEPVPLRSKKQKSKKATPDYYVDSYALNAIGGKGGDGCISFLKLWVNDKAGPDGGDGGNGGHVIFRASNSIRDLSHLTHSVRAEDGEKGYNKDCNGKNAKHTYVDVPVGTIIRNSSGRIVGDLKTEDTMFIAARGGCGGRGNSFFVSDINQAPEVAEIGAMGEKFRYILEVKSMAHFGLVGLPNAGKSTLLRAVSRARPEVAAYEFTTVRPYIGVIHFSDYEQIYIADLPGLIKNSHKNEGLGIQFLKHTERCLGLIYIIDFSRDNPISQLDILKHELAMYSEELVSRPSVIVANKMDLEDAQINLIELEADTDIQVIPISAKTGKNLSSLLKYIRKIYDELLSQNDSSMNRDRGSQFDIPQY